MAMNVQAQGEHDEADLNTTINTTPLVDVMLVMLIIFDGMLDVDGHGFISG